jgi:hypothetical protein
LTRRAAARRTAVPRAAAWIVLGAGIVLTGVGLSPASAADPTGSTTATSSTTTTISSTTTTTLPATSSSTTTTALPASSSTTSTTLPASSSTSGPLASGSTITTLASSPTDSTAAVAPASSTTVTSEPGAAPPSGTLSISAPELLDLGAVGSGGRVLAARMGTVTVTDTRGVVGGAWTARVSATAFTIEGGAAGQRVAPSSIAYWSGPATARSGTAALAPGQPGPSQAVPLTATRTAFSATRVTGANTAAWNPTVIVRVPAGALAGRYRGAIIHSVA